MLKQAALYDSFECDAPGARRTRKTRLKGPSSVLVFSHMNRNPVERFEALLNACRVVCIANPETVEGPLFHVFFQN